MARAEANKIRYCKAPLSKKIKQDAVTVVSEALVKKGVTNLVPKIHVKRGDVVILTTGSKKVGKGKTGKVLNVFPKHGKIIVEGINVITKAAKPRTAMGSGGLVKKEAPIFASRVMLYCTACKNPTRIKHKTLENGKKTRECKKCGEAFDA
jgi:ribosomal protein L24, bacterial/organelle